MFLKTMTNSRVFEWSR